MKQNKDNKIKVFFNKLKEAWKDPRKKAGIKLLSYFIFFFILLLLTAITNYISYINKDNVNNDNTKSEEKIDNTNFINKQNKLLENKHSINYIITINNIVYKINGLLENNTIEGYLENDNNIKKVIIKDNKIYELINGIETELDNVINCNYINTEYLLDIIKDKNVIIENKDEVKNYKYSFIDNGNNLNIIFSTDKDKINKIDINLDNEEYMLNFYN